MLNCDPATMRDRSRRASTVEKGQASDKRHNQALAYRLCLHASEGRLPQLLDMLDKNEFGSTEYSTGGIHMEYGSTLIECIRKGNMKKNYGLPGLLTAVHRLYEKGADMAADCVDQDILSFAIRTGDIPLVQFILSCTPDGMAFQTERIAHMEPRLSSSKTVTMSEFLIKNGATLTARGFSEETILMHQLRRYRPPEGDILKMITFLVGEGCDVNAVNNRGEAALHQAIHTGGDPAIIRFLIKHNADVNAGDRNGFTPLHWAVREGNLQYVKILCQHRAKIQTRDHTGENVLDLVVRLTTLFSQTPKTKDLVSILEYLEVEHDRRMRAATFAEIGKQHRIPKDMVEKILNDGGFYHGRGKN